MEHLKLKAVTVLGSKFKNFNWKCLQSKYPWLTSVNSGVARVDQLPGHQADPWGQLYKTLNYDLTSHRVVNI